MSNSSKTKKDSLAAPNREVRARPEKLEKKSQPLWMRFGIAMAALAMIGFTVSQFVPPGGTAPVVPLASTPTASSGDVTLSPVPAEQVGQTASQTIPTIGAGTTAPSQFAGLERTSYTQGAQALTDINKLHGSDITLSDGYYAVYSWQNLKLTAWVGAAGSSANAAILVKQMQDSIARGGSPFSNVQPVTAGGLSVFQVQGPGGSNYFYQSAGNVVWLTIQAPDAASVNNLLESAVKTFSRA